jgi:hypothetical protein
MKFASNLTRQRPAKTDMLRTGWKTNSKSGIDSHF